MTFFIHDNDDDDEDDDDDDDDYDDDDDDDDDDDGDGDDGDDYNDDNDDDAETYFLLNLLIGKTNRDIMWWQRLAFVRGILQWRVDSHHKGPVTWSFDVFFDVRLNRRLDKQSKCLWFETPSPHFWRHYNVFNMKQ